MGEGHSAPVRLGLQGVVLTALAVIAFSTACDLVGLGGPSGPTPGPVPRPTRPPADSAAAAPSAKPDATTTPEATATPEATPNLTSEQAEELVFELVRPCADQISISREAPVNVAFSPFYNRDEESWTGQASSDDESLSFGRWKIVDASGDVIAVDDTARAITSAGAQCTNPVSLRAGGRTPPLMLMATSTPTAVPTSTITPVPISNLTKNDVDRLIFRMVRSCADSVSASRATPVQVAFATIYNLNTSRWDINVTSEDESLSLGRWQVADTTGEVTPLDDVARAISPPGTMCNAPVAVLATGGSPPLVSTPTPVPTPALTPVPTPSPLVSTAQQAELRVWVKVFNCYDHFPDLASFSGHPDDVGRGGQIRYHSLWTMAGQCFDWSDFRAGPPGQRSASLCGLPANASFPAVVTGEQAELLVWVATYDCFDPKPAVESFTFYQENPQRWLVDGKETVTVDVTVQRVVEGTTETFVEQRTQLAHYGLWVVDTSTATITPWDDLAEASSTQQCYRQP